MKKRILAALVASAAVLSLAGCNTDGGSSSGAGNSNTNDNTSTGGNSNAGDSSTGGDNNSTPSSGDGDVLTILAWTNNSDIENMKTIFCNETGTPTDKINIVACGNGGGDAREQYMQYLQADGDADLMCLEADWILQYINDDSLTSPLSSIGIEESNFANPYAYTVAIGKNEAGVLKGASFQATPGGFVYRADLADQYLGVKSPEEMQALVSDWTKFEETAAKLKEAGNIAITATEAGLWQVYQANRTTPWVKDGVVMMDNAENFYDIVKNYTEKGYVTGATQWNDAWYATVSNGDALGAFLSTWGMTDSSGGQLHNFAAEKEGADANMAFCAGPQEYFWGGTWLGVSTKCNSNDLAKQFVEFFTCNDETMEKYALQTGDYCNNSVVMKKIVDEKSHTNKYLVGGQDQFAYFYEQAPKIKMDGLITKYDSRIKELFNNSVADYAITGTYATKEEAINAFKDAVAADYQELKFEGDEQ